MSILPEVWTLGLYYPAYYKNEDIPTNPDFNDYSDSIIGLEEEDLDCIEEFKTYLLPHLNKIKNPIFLTPPTSSGIKLLGENLANDLRGNFLTNTFKKSQEKRIKANNISAIPKEKTIILLDDLIDTGITIQSCLKILKQAEFKSVHVIVLGTIWKYDYEIAHEKIEIAHQQIKQEEERKNIEEIKQRAKQFEEKTKTLTAEIADSILEDMADDLHQFRKHFYDIELGLEEYRKEARAVVEGKTIFSPNNIFQNVFLTNLT